MQGRRDTCREGGAHTGWEGHMQGGRGTCRVGDMQGGRGTRRVGGAHAGWEGHMQGGRSTYRVGGAHAGWEGHMQGGRGTHRVGDMQGGGHTQGGGHAGWEAHTQGGGHAGRDRLTFPSVPWSDVSLPCLRGHIFLLFHILLCLPLLLPLPHPSSLLLLYTSVHYLAKFVLPHFLQPSSHHCLALGLHSLTPAPLVNRLVQGRGRGRGWKGAGPHREA